MAVQGKCDPKFAKVKEEFERSFAERGEVGASVCLSVDGQTAVDLWGGMANPETGDPWQEDTVSIVFSCTKAAVALCAHILIDRGQLNPAALVKDYWPEFAQKGKEKTTVQMMLNHESALPTLRDPVPAGAFADWDYMAKRMADEEAFWEVGARNGYHMINFGWTVGELVRRVSGKSLGTFFREEVAEKTGARFWIGLPESEKVHIAPIRQYVPKPDDKPSEFVIALMTDPNSIQHKSFLNTGGWDFNDRKRTSRRDRRWRRVVERARTSGVVHGACDEFRQACLVRPACRNVDGVDRDAAGRDAADPDALCLRFHEVDGQPQGLVMAPAPARSSARRPSAMSARAARSALPIRNAASPSATR